jgi:twinkle protein
VKTQGQTVTVERDDHDFLLELGRRQGVSRILPASSMHKLVEQFRPPQSEGLSLPWDDTHRSVRFMPGKVSVWSGPSFAGKTALLRQIMLHAVASTNRRVLFISLEEEPDEVWREFTCMAAHTRTPSREQIEAAEQLFEGKLWVFDSDEPIEPTILFGIIRFAVERFGFSQIVIDSLMRLQIRTDDFDGQREMGNMLGRLAKMTKTHIHLVAHPRKTANSRESMDMYDIRGAQDIVAQADLVLTLERTHKPGGETNVLTLWKQRGDVNWIGKIKLWYCPRSRQLKYRETDQPERYLPDAAFGELALGAPVRDPDFDVFPEDE